MSLVPALAEAQAARIERMKRMGVYRRNVVPMARVRVIEPEALPVAAVPVETRPEDDVIELPNFLPLRRSEIDGNAAFRLSDASIILNIIERLSGVSILDLKSERRTAKVVKPRQIACWAMRELTTMSLPRIGKHLGGRDHTTVLYAANKIEELRTTDPEIRLLTDQVVAAACKEMQA